MATTDVLEIAQSGDVVLICAPSEKLDVPQKLRVSSIFLMHASPVFKALLGPKFREGNALATNGFVEVSLPDDAAEPMATMLKALHLDQDIMRYLPTSNQILEIAILADKYDCCTAMNHAAYYWISKRSQEFAPRKMGKLLLASYHFQQPGLFQKMCNGLIIHTSGSIVAPTEAKTTGLEMLFANLDKARSHELEGMHMFLEDILGCEAGSTTAIDNNPCRASKNCSYEALRAQAFIKTFFQLDLWPSSRLKGRSVDNCLRQFRDFDTAWLEDIELCTQDCAGRSFDNSRRTAAKFKEEASVIEDDRVYFCLYCVREGDMSWKEDLDECKHSQEY